MTRLLQGRVARSMVSANRWLSGIKTYRLSWYLPWVSANHASSNSAQVFFFRWMTAVLKTLAFEKRCEIKKEESVVVEVST